MGEGTEKIRLPTPVLTGSGSRVCCALSAPRWRSPVVLAPRLRIGLHAGA